MGTSVSRVEHHSSAAELTLRVKQTARSAGFHLVGVASIHPATHPEAFQRWHALGNYEPLAHIFEHNEARLDPSVRHPWARSVVSLGFQYGERGCSEPTDAERSELATLTLRPHLPSKPGCDDLDPAGWRIRDAEARRRSGEIISRSPALGVGPWIARYERDANYHRINDGNVERFISSLPAAAGRAVRAQEVVEHSTFFERDLAYQAGLGWVGKNNMIIHPRLGSFFVLTSVFVDLELAPDAMVTDHCGTCTLCLDACPTGALDGPRNIVINKCLTARSVDIGGTVPDEYLAHLPGHFSGCDICQNVCPYNTVAKGNPSHTGSAPERWSEVTIMDLMRCDDAERLTIMSGSLLARIQADTLKRNAVLVGARILRVASGDSSQDDLDQVAKHVDPRDLPLVEEAIREQRNSPFDAVRAAAIHALSFVS